MYCSGFGIQNYGWGGGVGFVLLGGGLRSSINFALGFWGTEGFLVRISGPKLCESLEFWVILERLGFWVTSPACPTQLNWPKRSELRIMNDFGQPPPQTPQILATQSYIRNST